MSAAAETTEAIAENVTIEIVVARAALGSIAARAGVSAVALRDTIRRQGGARSRGTPKLYVALHNQAVIDAAIRRAVGAALSD